MKEEDRSVYVPTVCSQLPVSCLVLPWDFTKKSLTLKLILQFCTSRTMTKTPRFFVTYQYIWGDDINKVSSNKAVLSQLCKSCLSPCGDKCTRKLSKSSPFQLQNS